MNKPIQFTEQSSGIELQGNIDDCGPFLVYCVAAIANGKGIRQDIKTLEQSISFGEFLRDAFSKEGIDFNEIYQTLTSDNKNERLDKTKMKKFSKVASKVQLPEDEQEINASIAELEKKLFPKWHLDKEHQLPNEEKSKLLSQIGDAYKAGLSLYQESNWAEAEQKLVQVLKPVLSQSSMKSIYVNLEDVKDQVLDAVYHLGLIYLNESNYFNHHAKAAAIFQYCAEFSKKYQVSLKLEGDVSGNQEYFIRQAHLVENKFCQDMGTASNFNLDYSMQRSQQYKDELEKEMP